MSWIDSAIAMLPEHFVLAGIVVALVLEITGRAQKENTLAASLIAVFLGAAAAGWLSANGFAFAAFAGHYSVDASALAAKAIVLALAVPALLISRSAAGERAFSVLFLSSLYGVCLL